jgi:hypothetical protein
MPPLLKRIVVNGLVTAGILAVLGFLLAEVGAIWLSGTTQPRSGNVAAGPDPAVASLHSRVPLAMAAWGFGFIAVSELVLYAWRGNPAEKTARKPAEPAPDPAEQLLEQLLAEADAAARQRSETSTQKTADPIESGTSEPVTNEPAILSADR